MTWEFESVAGPFNPRLTEGPAWDGTALLFTHIPASRIYRYDPGMGQCTVFREQTNHTNGLAFDAEGRLYGCCSGGRSIVRFETDGTTTTIVDSLDGVSDHIVDRIDTVEATLANFPEALRALFLVTNRGEFITEQALCFSTGPPPCPTPTTASTDPSTVLSGPQAVAALGPDAQPGSGQGPLGGFPGP